MSKGVQEAKEKAIEYRNYQQQSGQFTKEQNPEEETNNQQSSPAPRSEASWNDLISHRIEEAQRNGAFDNLRNKGKPLAIERNPFVPADRQMANDLLKNNNLAPHWISERTAMLQTIDRFRLHFQSTSQQFQQAWQHATDDKRRTLVQKRWDQQLGEWTEEIQALNRRINTINLQQPIARLEIFKILLDEELQRAGMMRELGIRN
jgi:Domain of unknown function (DUF1992)